MALVIQPGVTPGTIARVPDAVVQHLATFLNGHGVSHISQLSRGFYHARPLFFSSKTALLASLLIRRRGDLQHLTEPEKRALEMLGPAVRVLKFEDFEGTKLPLSDSVARLIATHFSGLQQLSCKIESESTLRILRPLFLKLTDLSLECEVSISALKQMKLLKRLELHRTPMSSVLAACTAMQEITALKLVKMRDVEAGSVATIAKRLPNLQAIELHSIEDADQLQGIVAFPHLETVDVTIDRELEIGDFFEKLRQQAELKNMSLNLRNPVDANLLRELREIQVAHLQIGFDAQITEEEIRVFFTKQTKLQSLTVLTATGEQLKALSCCTALKSLTLGSQVSLDEHVAIDWLSSLQALDTVAFRYTGHVSIATFQALQMLPKLRSLTLATIGLPKEGWEKVRQFPALRHLELSYIQRESEVIVKLLTLAPLESLLISGAFIDDSLLQKVSAITTLRHLRIGFSAHSPGFIVTPDGIMAISSLQSLNELQFEHLYWIKGHEGFEARLREALPDTRIGSFV